MPLPPEPRTNPHNQENTVTWIDDKEYERIKLRATEADLFQETIDSLNETLSVANTQLAEARRQLIEARDRAEHAERKLAGEWPYDGPLAEAKEQIAAAMESLREFNHVEGEPLSEVAAVAASAYGFAKHRADTTERQLAALRMLVDEAKPYIERADTGAGPCQNWLDRAATL